MTRSNRSVETDLLGRTEENAADIKAGATPLSIQCCHRCRGCDYVWRSRHVPRCDAVLGPYVYAFGQYLTCRALGVSAFIGSMEIKRTDDYSLRWTPDAVGILGYVLAAVLMVFVR